MSFFQEKLIEDVKALFRVLVLFIPIPMFYALWEQQVNYFLLKLPATEIIAAAVIISNSVLRNFASSVEWNMQAILFTQ